MVFDVFLRGHNFLGHHGVTAEERVVGHRLKANIRCRLETEAGNTDNLDDTISYIALAELLEAVSTASRAHLLEALALEFITACFAKWPVVQYVDIEIVKPRPLVSLAIDEVGVRLEASRDSSPR